MIRHILLIIFKENAIQDEIVKLQRLFEAMPDEVEGVVSVEWGKK